MDSPRPSQISPRPPQKPENLPEERGEEERWFGQWFVDWVDKIFNRGIEEMKEGYVSPSGSFMAREAEVGKKGFHKFEVKELKISQGAFSQALNIRYNEAVYENQIKNWEIVLNELEAVFGDSFDRKLYEGNPVRFFSEIVFNEGLSEIFNQIVSDKANVYRAWEAITRERDYYFEDLVLEHYAESPEYKKARDRFNELLEMENQAIEDVEEGTDMEAVDDFENEFGGEYNKLKRYLLDKYNAFFNDIEAMYYAEDEEFQKALKIIQSRKEEILKQNLSSDKRVDELQKKYQSDDLEFQNAVNYVNEREVMFKVLFNFAYSDNERVIPSAKVNWEDVRKEALKVQSPVGIVAAALATPELVIMRDRSARPTLLSAKMGEPKKKELKKVSTVVLSPLSYSDPEYKRVVAYVEGRRQKIEAEIINEKLPLFNEAWDAMFEKINRDILQGGKFGSYDAIYKRHGKEWEENFRVDFREVFGYAGKGLGGIDLKKLKEHQKTHRFKERIDVLRMNAFYEESIVLCALRWEDELSNDVVLRDGVKLMKDTQLAEKARLAHGMMQFIERVENDDSVRAFYTKDDPLKLRYEKVLMEAKIQNSSDREIEVALEVVRKFFEAFKKHFGEKLDMAAWRILVSREPMLAKAEALLFQKQYDSMAPEFRRQELLKRYKNDDMTLKPEELVAIEKELSYLGQFKDVFSLFFKSLLPWNLIERPKLLSEGENVAIRVLPGAKEAGDILAWVARSRGGKKGEDIAKVVKVYSEVVDNWLEDRGRAIQNIGTELFQAAMDRANTGKWTVDKNRYIVHNFTTEAKDGAIAQGIKSLMKTMVEEPEAIKSKKWLPWLAKYGSAAVVGGFTTVTATLIAGNVPTLTSVVAGAAGGTFVERFKGEIKAATAFAIPGALAGVGIVVAVAGVGALTGGLGILVIGLAAAIFGLFGAWLMYRTEFGKNIREGIANYVYSAELEWFKEWNEKIECANLGRSVFELAAEKAEARSGEMYLRSELARDKRYQDFEDACIEAGLSVKARRLLLERIRRQPYILSEPDLLYDFVEDQQDKKMIEGIIRRYREKSKDALKVGLERRYEDLKNELSKLDKDLPSVITELEGANGKVLLAYDDKLKEMLIAKGISPNTIDRVFSEVRATRPGGKESIEDAYAITQAMYALAKAAGAQAEKVGEWGAYIASLTLGKAAREERMAREEELRTFEFERDEALVRVVLALREVMKRKDMLADEGELKKLLTDVGLKMADINKLFEIYNEKTGGASSRMAIERRAMGEEIRKIEEDAILAFDIVAEAQNRYVLRIKSETENELIGGDEVDEIPREGELKPDEGLLADSEIDELRNIFSEDDEVLAALDLEKDNDIPLRDQIPNDRALMYRFGMVKIDHFGRVLEIDELPDVEVVGSDGVTKLKKSARDYFDDKKDAFKANFDKLRIGLKREKLLKSAMAKLIQTKKEDYVSQVLAKPMNPDERLDRIRQRTLQILENYEFFL